MKPMYLGGVSMAAVVVFNMAAFAQATSQQTSTPPASGAQQTTADQQVTVTGCIQSEADYRRAKDAGRGGAAGTGVGAGNEYVLINASMSTGAATGTPTGTAGTSGASMLAYELTGSNEGQASPHVGRRVEISGKLKAAEVAPSGRPTGGATAGKPPEGVEITGQDLKLRELEVASIRTVTGTCPTP